jgi:hypothetical protein
MTDDDLDRALLALPLETPGAGLRPRILAATVWREPATFRPWELWLLGTLVALAVWLCIDILTAPVMLSARPHAVTDALEFVAVMLRAAGLTSPVTLFWLAVGLSSAWWISHLTLMPQPRIIGKR